MYICIYDILAIFDQSWKKIEDRRRRRKKKIEKYFKSSCLRELKILSKPYRQDRSKRWYQPSAFSVKVFTRATERVNEKPVWQLAQPWDWRASWQSHLLKIASLYIGLLGFFCSWESWALFRPTLPMGSITGLMARKGMFNSAWKVIGGVFHVPYSCEC